MYRAMVWMMCAIIVGLLAFVCWPDTYAQDMVVAEAMVIANLQHVSDIQREILDRGEPALSREQVRELLDRLEWPTGRIGYHPWYVYNSGGAGNWVIWVDPIASEADCAALARPWRLERLSFRKYGLRSWELEILSSETVPVSEAYDESWPRAGRMGGEMGKQQAAR